MYQFKYGLFNYFKWYLFVSTFNFLGEELVAPDDDLP